MDRRPAWIWLLFVALVVLAGCTAGTPADPTDTLTTSPTPFSSVTTTYSEEPTPTPSTSNGTTSPSPSPSASTQTPHRSERTEFRVTVVRIVDGDTVEVQFRDGEVEDVRLLGVDTPEVHTETDPVEWEGIPDSTVGREHLSVWGDRASSFASSHLEIGETIRIVVDDETDRRGSYGRLLVYVFDDGVLFNLLLIEQGYARMYDSSFSRRVEFADAEKLARDDDVGVWDFESGTSTPTNTGTETAALEVVEIHEDAAGNDHETENDEYIVIKNTGSQTLDLNGWRVEDDAGHTYQFPDGFSLAPGAEVTLYTGSGTDTASSLYWGSDSAIWNNGGDIIFVFDESGEVVIKESYS